MKILIIYSEFEANFRKTIYDHLFSFRDYGEGIEVHYCDILTRAPFYLRFVTYDAIIFHYTVLARRWTPYIWKMVMRSNKFLRHRASIKAAIPQDEYAHTDALCKMFKDYGVGTVFTCASPVDYQTLYPSHQTGLTHYKTIFTGYVDENTLKKIQSMPPLPREIDIGYRARNLPYWIGSFGQLKKKVGDAFLAKKPQSSLTIDVSTDNADVFYGDDWIHFLRRCRTVLGCLGGSSLYDPDGRSRYQTERFMKEHPNASFEEVEKVCFPGKDHTLSLFALSPRHFECAMTKTCQVLVEGDYHSVFLPGKHYIEIKKDFSNIDEVLDKIADRSLCESIAEQTYRDVVASGNYTYRAFVSQIVDHLKEIHVPRRESTIGKVLFLLVGRLLQLRHRNPSFYRLRYRGWLFINRGYRYLRRRYYRYLLKREWDETAP